MRKPAGKDINRPQFQAMPDYMRECDVLTVESYSRLARDTRDLLNIVDVLNKKGVAFISQKEQIDTSTPAGRFMLSVFASLAQFERKQISQGKQKELPLRSRKGVWDGLKSSHETTNFTSIVKDWRAGRITAVEAMKRAETTKATFYRKVKALEA